MTRTFTAITVSTAFAITAFASIASAGGADANGDGLLTIEEVQAAYPDITADTFSAMDANGDGALDAEEAKAAEAAGLIKESDG